jgi:hypothetical protein
MFFLFFLRLESCDKFSMTVCMGRLHKKRRYLESAAAVDYRHK